MSALLAVALFGPAAFLVLDRRRARVGALAVAALWLLAVVLDRDATLGRFGAGAAPVAIGTWLLVASVAWPTRRLVVRLTTVAAAVSVGGVALASGRGELSDAIGGLAIAAAVLVVAARAEADGGLVPAIGAVLGVALVATGEVRDSLTLVLVGAAVAVVGSGWRVRRAGIVLLPALLSIGAVAPTSPWTLAVALALAAAVLAERPAVALGLWALVGGALLVDPLLLGAAAVLVAVTLHPAVAITALPGVAVAIGVTNGIDSRWLLVLAALAAVTALRLWKRPEDAMPGTPAPATMAALAVGGWLLAAPETWLDSPALTSWGTGTMLAGVAGVVGAFVAASFTDATFAMPDLEVADPPFPARDPAWATPAALVSLAVLALAGGALVASTVS